MENQIRKAQTSILMRFIDAFLNEENIKWILGAGVLILLGSSAMLVASHFNDLSTPFWKYSIMFMYTAAIYTAGQWCYNYLSLRKTGTVLMALCILLFPILFLGLHWVQNERGWLDIENAVLLAGTLVFTYWSANRIFKHMLLKSQPTFLASYLLLCLSGSLASLVSAESAPIFAAFMWGIFLLGSIKVNRHVFWLSDEHKTPRIFGFFPIALLGGQFLIVFLLHLALYIDIAWMGFGCALVALPILITADTVWKVYKERTGGLGTPKASVAAPVISGLILCAVAMPTAASGVFSNGSPYALVPTAIAVAIMMGLVAHRTNKKPLIWAMLAAVLIAYNFSPVFFLALAKAVIQSSANAVGEERLPYAFYGLTYMPLISALTGFGWYLAKKKNRLFCSPLRSLSIVLACVWLFFSLTEIKAMFLVGLAMTAAFGCQAFLYRKPRLMILIGIAWMLTSFGIYPFLHIVFGGKSIEIFQASEIFFSTTIGSLALYMAGRYLGNQLRIQERCNTSWLETVGTVATVVLSIAWVICFGLFENITALPIICCVVLFSLLVHQCLHWYRQKLSTWCVVFTYAMGIILFQPFNPSFSTIISFACMALLAQWTISYIFEHHNTLKICCIFSDAFRKTAYLGLSFLLFQTCVFPIIGLTAPFWICRLLLVGWAFDAARRSEKPIFGYIASASTFFVLTLDMIHFLGGQTTLEWLPLVWASFAFVLLSVVTRFLFIKKSGGKESESTLNRSVSIPLKNTLLTVLSFCAVGSLIFFTWPCRIAGIVSLAGLWFHTANKGYRIWILMLANFHILASASQVTAPQANEIIAFIFYAYSGYAATAISAVAGLSLLAWQMAVPFLKKHIPVSSDIIKTHRAILYAILAIALLTTFCMQLTPLSLVLSSLTFLCAISDQLIAACRKKQELRVWVAESIVIIMTVHCIIHGVIHFGHGFSMFAFLIIAAALWAIAEITKSHSTMSIMSVPFRKTALAMPAVTVFWALCRPIMGLETVWLGARSLALFFAGAAYFLYGISRNGHLSQVGGTLIANLALFLLWDELSWTDPQLFMIPIGITIVLLTMILDDEIPNNFHRPLHYLGALVILVSPTFNIITGNWLPILSLMVISVIVMLAAIGLRLKALLYTGASFLVADIFAMVIRGSIDKPNILWVAGLILGVAIVALGAFTERHRENLLQQMRIFNASLGTWK